MSTLNARIAIIVFAALAAFAAGCGGGGGGGVLSGLTNGGGSGNGSKPGFYLHIVIPATGGSSQSNRRRPKYISSSTTQLAYSVDGNAQTPISLVPTSNPDCTAGPPVTCTVPFQIAPGPHTFSFTLEDSNGSPLSGATNVSDTVVAGAATTLNITLGGILASIAVQSQTANSNRVAGSASNGFQIYGNSSVQFAIVLEDADGNTIVGAMPSPSVAPSAGAPFTIAAPSAGSNIWTVTSTYQATNPATSSNTSLTIVASPVPSSGPTTNFQQTVALQLYQPWIFVVNSGGGGSITAYDEQGNQKTVPAYAVSTPQGIAIDTSPSTADPSVGDMYVTNVGGPSVKAFVLATAAPTTLPGSFSGIASPGPAVFDPHNDQLYIANLASSGQTMQTYSSTGVAGSFSTSTNIANATALAYDSVDNYIFLASGIPANKIYEFNEAGSTLTSWTTSLSNPSGLAYDPNWGWIFAANKGSNAIAAYNTTGAPQALSGFSVSSPTAMLFDPHSKTFYVVTSSGMKAFAETSTAGTVTAASLSGTFPNLNTPTEILILP